MKIVIKGGEGIIKFKFTATIEVPDADKFTPKERVEKDLMELFISEGMIPHELKLIDYYVEQEANDDA